MKRAALAVGGRDMLQRTRLGRSKRCPCARLRSARDARPLPSQPPLLPSPCASIPWPRHDGHSARRGARRAPPGAPPSPLSAPQQELRGGIAPRPLAPPCPPRAVPAPARRRPPAPLYDVPRQRQRPRPLSACAGPLLRPLALRRRKTRPPARAAAAWRCYRGSQLPPFGFCAVPRGVRTPWRAAGAPRSPKPHFAQPIRAGRAGAPAGGLWRSGAQPRHPWTDALPRMASMWRQQLVRNAGPSRVPPSSRPTCAAASEAARLVLRAHALAHRAVPRA
eukprot:scaffold239573_cov28-Tisochrysis_lutea.AAC.5